MSEVNALIQEIRITCDDGCDHTARFIDGWNSAARARTRAPYTPPVRATKVGDAITDSAPLVKIGYRPNYGRTILIGIYQLHLHGNTDWQIAKKLNMSTQKVTHLMKHDTRMRHEVYLQASASALPKETEILRRLAGESQA